jgi:hypothetical protein
MYLENCSAIEDLELERAQPLKGHDNVHDIVMSERILRPRNCKLKGTLEQSWSSRTCMVNI